MAYSSEPGYIGWVDLTVKDADGVRDFYSRVAGWRFQPVEMGTHVDYNMMAPGRDEAIAGICHALTEDSGFPPQWLMYINVEDLDAALAAVTEAAGEILVGPVGDRPAMRLAVARDPAGAAFALVEYGSE